MALGFKTGGRQKGSLNKTTRTNREKLQKIFDEELDSTRFKLALSFLSDKEYVDAILKIGSFLLPKACNVNTAEIEPEEVSAKRRLFMDAPIGEPEEVERQRAADPEEAELAKLIYNGEKRGQRDAFLHFPIATPEEHKSLTKEMDEVAFATLVLWNEKHTERWKRQIEELEQQGIREGRIVKGGSTPPG